MYYVLVINTLEFPIAPAESEFIVFKWLDIDWNFESTNSATNSKCLFYLRLSCYACRDAVPVY